MPLCCHSEATSWRLITAHTLLFTGSTQQRSLQQTARPSTTKTQEISSPQYPWQHLKHLCILLKVFFLRAPGSVCASSAYIILCARVWFKKRIQAYRRMRLDLNCQLLYSVQHLSVLTSSPSLGSSTELHCPGGVGGGTGGGRGDGPAQTEFE